MPLLPTFLVLSLHLVGSFAFRTSPCSLDCNRTECPSACVSPVTDPCGCCVFICGAPEGDPCSHREPCEEGLSCQSSSNGEVCICQEAKKMVCGNNDVTYTSVCQFNKETAKSNLTMKHWGPCEFAPEIASPPTHAKFQLGEPLTLDCEVKGFPIPTISWTFTGRDGQKKQLPSDDQQTAIQVRGGPEHLMVTSWVQVIETRLSDAGFYECRAKNSLGTTSAEASVSIKRHRG